MTFSGAFVKPFRPVFDPGLAVAAVTPWYLSGGVAAANCIAAYTPKGKASLALSYNNDAAPGNGLLDGTYDAAPGVAPTWDAVNGWKFNGTTQYLTTGVVPATGFSMIVRLVLDGAGENVQMIAGASNDTASGFAMRAVRSALTVVYIYGSGWTTVLATLSGVHAIAKQQGYFNGAPTISGGRATLTTTWPIFIAQQNVAGAVYAPYFFSGSIQALVIYNTTLTAPQVLAISTAMAAL